MDLPLHTRFGQAFAFWSRRTSKVQRPATEDAMPDKPPDTSSPLSSLTTIESFTTAVASPGLRDESDGGSTISDHTATTPQTPVPYYSAKRLPPEIREHCRVYLEESLPQQAIFLLNSLLSSRSSNPLDPVYCPPPSQISFLCSIIIHPDFTTRPRDPEWPEISLQALVYLRDLLDLLGPINAGFKESTLFNGNSHSDWDSDAQLYQDGGSSADERGLVELTPRHARDSVWRKGHDFFYVVGWAFNCSVKYPERWQYWKRWLEFMLDVLEKDAQERLRLDMENGSADCPLLRDSMLAGYITHKPGRSAGGGLKHIIRALFADGHKSSSAGFQEIWHREHRTRSHRAISNKRKRERVNIDRGEYGNYLDDESQPSEPPTPQKSRTALSAEDRSAQEITYIESIPLRQRLFSMLSYLCYHIPKNKPIDLTDLYEYSEMEIKSLPLSIFTPFISSTASALAIDMQVTMLQGVLRCFLPASAISPSKVDRAQYEINGISPVILERCFLPYPANTIEIEDNAKMSVILENLLSIVWEYAGEHEPFSARLLDAVNKGIEAREAKVTKRKVRGGRPVKAVDEHEKYCRAALNMSGERLRCLAVAIMAVEGADEDDAMRDD
ncbi:hypothetical protein F5Y16DRAFT_423223 [Xylariaceae sp. FL0255]|nr:hypothetical protein F5Y16DRAFT_423223 [Xylariaceae sp. FL0255]